MRHIPTYASIQSDAGSEVIEQVVAQRDRLARRLESVRTVIPVASGKGGVGKSAVTANLAAVLADRGLRVGALDADLNGPSLARMLGVTGQRLVDGEDGVEPPSNSGGIRVVSMELLQGDEDAPLRWREPEGDSWLWQSSLEAGALREFLSDVAWGELDALLIDVPPGTDKISRLLSLVPAPGPVLLVTTPSEMARSVVARSIRLVREAGCGPIGLIANMTEHVCPDCGHRSPLYAADGAARLAAEAEVEIWARIPFDPRMAVATDEGTPFALTAEGGPVGEAFRALADRIEATLPAERDSTNLTPPQPESDA